VTIQEAAKSLDDHLNQYRRVSSWYVTTGIGKYEGKPCLYVYTRDVKATKANLDDNWQGYHIEVRFISTPAVAYCLCGTNGVVELPFLFQKTVSHLC
jgi:hypothetical protein